jgi:TolB-like protein/Flp pilus assembly protein TadD
VLRHTTPDEIEKYLMMEKPSFFAELKRRNVLRAAVFYVGAVWALAQGISQLGPSIGAPEWATRWFLVAAVIGFPFWIAFAWFYEFTPQGLKRESEIDPTDSIAHRTGRKLDFAIIGVLAFAVVLLLTDRFVLRRGVNEIRAVAISEKSIAVLPLMNSTGDPANEYFSDGMSEEFIYSLSRLRDLKVIGRTSSFQFKGKNDDSKAIGEKLGVYYLLEGSVRKSADRMRIAVALVKAGDGANVWSEIYDRELKDIFAVQSEIAGAVAKELKVALLGNDGQATQLTTAATPSNQNVEAYNALLQGNFHFNRHTADDFRKAIGYYEDAIRLDPRYALAYARLSTAASNLGGGYGGVPTKEREEAKAKGRASAKRALELDPNLAEAHVAQGIILRTIDFDLGAAEVECRRAFELAPQDAGTMGSLSALLSILGKLDEAAGLRQQTIALEPLKSSNHFNLAYILTALGRYDEAEAALHKVIELQPQSAQTYAWLAHIEILRGKSGAALELAKQETDLFWRTYALALAHFANGDRAEADVALKTLIDKYADSGGSQIATVYALRKDPEKMFEWLEHARTMHDGGATELLVNPFLRAYKDDPRFIAFGQKIGVMPKDSR